LPISETASREFSVYGACTLRPKRFRDEHGRFSRMADAWELLVGPPTPAPEANDGRPAVATAALGRLSGVEIAAAPP
jgi:hypothetical protein